MRTCTLSEARILVVGAGGLGCPAAMALAASGAGTIGLVDDDDVDATNLHRQILHADADVGSAKVESAARSLRERWPGVAVETHVARLDERNAEALLARYDVVIDAVDGFATKFLLNDVAVTLGVPLVHGGALRWRGQVMAIAFGGPCLRCVFESPPPPEAIPRCREAGIVGPVAGVVGAMQALEALRLLRNGAIPDGGALVVYDALAGTVRRLKIRARPG